jgi:di/tricarboxylate transporter
MMTEILPLTTEMLLVLSLLLFTIFLFVTELVRVDVAAMLVMVIIGLLGLIPPTELFNGFASNAVISIIAIMIIGAGLDNAGVMTRVANFILKIGGTTEKGILPVVLGTASAISSFMQNVGTAALLLPVVSRISARTNVPLSRLLIPMGYSALLGGTLTLVGCSSLILLNDLLLNANQTLPPDVAQMQPYGLFDTLPIGIALVCAGILYFVFAGHWILPARQTEATRTITPVDYFQQRYGINGSVFELLVTPNSPLVGKTILEYEQQVNQSAAILALLKGKNLRISPAPDVTLEPGDSFAMLGSQAAIEAFSQQFHLLLKPQVGIFTEMLVPTLSGVSEVIIPQNSQVIGKSLLEIRLRKKYGLSVLEVLRQQQSLREGLRDLKLQSSDTLLVHSTWEDLAALKNNRDFVSITQHNNHGQEEQQSQNTWLALFFFTLAIGLVLFTDLRLAIALLVGALGMIVTGVISIDEAYKRVSWQTVFLLAGLIPLGQAVESTGTAAFLAQYTLHWLGNMPSWVLQTVLAILATLFTQVMSNVGTTVLLVPLAINIAVQSQADPAVFALTVALATSNSFILPTHQVNALIMGPGGYRVTDYLRAGSIMTVLFLIILIPMMNIVF